MSKTQTTASQMKSKPSATTSEIDLSQLTIRELMDLRDRVESELSKAQVLRIGSNDVAVEYCIKAHTTAATVHESAGVLMLPAVLHQRLIATAPGRAEALLNQQILEPIMADLVDVFDSVSPERSSLLGLTQHTGSVDA